MKLLITTSLLGFFSGASCLLASDYIERDVKVKGTVDEVCSISEEDFSDMNFGSLAGSDGKLSDDAILPARQLGIVTCNYPVSIEVSSFGGALKKDESLCDFASIWANCVKYTAELSFDGQTATLNANGTGPKSQQSSISTSGPFAGNFTLEIILDNSVDKPLAQGSYSDTITVKIDGQL